MAFVSWLLALVVWLAALIPQETPTVVVPPTAIATETPAPATTPEPVLGIEAVVCAPQYAWDCGTALAIVWCESRNDQWATGALGETGWWQIHPIHGLGAAGYDPYISTEYAYGLWLAHSWRPWACARGFY